MGIMQIFHENYVSKIQHKNMKMGKEWYAYNKGIICLFFKTSL